MRRQARPVPIRTRFDDEDIAFLTRMGSALKLSMLIPFDPAWKGRAESRILLGDLRRLAGDTLRTRGALDGGAEGLLAPVDALLATPEALDKAGNGLALFSDGEEALAVALPSAPAPGAQIDLCFRLEAVLPQISGRDRFYLLELAQHGIRLWDCDGVTWEAVGLEGIETDIRSMPHFESAEYQALFHTTAGNRAHGGGSSYSGIGAGDKRDLKREIEGFFRQIDRGLREKLKEGDRPLILAGPGFLLPIYRQVNTFKGLREEELPGHPESMGSIADLHGRALNLMRTVEKKERAKALALYRENLSTERSCAGFTDLVPCAAEGRLTHLFLPEGMIQWGDFEPENGRTTLFEGYRDGARDLANLACVSALSGGARVYAVPREEMPEGASIAGLARSR